MNPYFSATTGQTDLSLGQFPATDLSVRTLGYSSPITNELDSQHRIIRSAKDLLHPPIEGAVFGFVLEKLTNEPRRQPTFSPKTALFAVISQDMTLPCGVILKNCDPRLSPEQKIAIAIGEQMGASLPEDHRVTFGSLVTDPSDRSLRFYLGGDNTAERVALDQRIWAVSANAFGEFPIFPGLTFDHIFDQSSPKLGKPCGITFSIPSGWNSPETPIGSANILPSVERRFFGGDKG